MYWLKKLKLHEADKDSLYNGKRLTDNIIDAAQALLRKAYHHIGGLEPVCLGQTLQFTVQRGEFVQILNVSNSHWVTLSNIGCKPGTVNIFDSIPNNPISSRTKEQIAAILFSEKEEIQLQFKPVQEQHGTADCGVFAVAFATALCSGKDPAEIHFIQHQLRPHLKKCLIENMITEFPQLQRKRKARGGRIEQFKIFCRCRQPEVGRMIQCDSCHNWFHDVCIETDSLVWKDLDCAWFCDEC